MGAGPAFNIAFETIAAVVLLGISVSTYRDAARMDRIPTETSSMIGMSFLGGSIALLMLAQSLLKLRKPPNRKGEGP